MINPFTTSGSGTDVRCALVVESKTVSADDVTAAVGLNPTRTRIMGEPVRATGESSPLVPFHQWYWQVPATTEPSWSAQLEALRANLGPYASTIKSLADRASIVLSAHIRHYGSDLYLGWTATADDIQLMADFGAMLSVDEYDETDEH